MKKRVKMRQKILKCVSASLAFLFLFSCITVNIYFPEAEVKKAAEEIVKEIVKEEGEKEKKDKKVQMMELDQLSLSLGSSSSLLPTVYVQQETQVSTPKIRALQNAMAERRPKLKPFFSSGNIGEMNDGYIKIRDESGLNLKDKALLRNMVNDENNDRRNMYAEVAVAMEIDASKISRIQKIFAQLWVKNAQQGWWIQKENGEWVKKQ
jgi:uncharacterized protein YdbL (DUF1318 family)